MSTQKSTILLKTGFTPICLENFQIRKELLNKGEKLVEAGHIQEVQERRQAGFPVDINAICIPQTCISNDPYKLEITLDSKRRILRAHCKCIAGGDGHCKHISGLVYLINNKRDEASTDKKCNWLAPSARAKRLYPNGEPFTEIFNIDPKYRMEDLSFKVSFEDKEKLRELMDETGNTNSPLYQLCFMNLEDTLPVENKPKLSDCVAKMILEPKKSTLPFKKQSPIDSKEREFYFSNIVLSNEKRKRLCELTIEQSKNSLWGRERKFRITGKFSKSRLII